MREEVNPNNGDAIRYHLCEKDENLVLSEQEVQRIAKHESMFERAKDEVEVIKEL
mgnify:CR=1 FL=1